MPRMEKGSPEAIAFGKKMKALREKAKISRPAVEKGKPEPAKISGGSGAGAGKRKRNSPSSSSSKKKTELRPLPTLSSNSPPPVRRSPPAIPHPQPFIPVMPTPETHPQYFFKPIQPDMYEEEEEIEGGKIPAPPSRIYGGKIPSPLSRSYNTSFEDKVDGIVVGGCLNDCPTCCGMGIVKIKGKGAKSSKVRQEPPHINPVITSDMGENEKNYLLSRSKYYKENVYGMKNKVTPEEREADRKEREAERRYR